MATTLGLHDDSGVAILNRIMQPDDAALTPDAAKALLSLKFPKADEQRMNRLASKARRGTLTDRERYVADQYNLVSHMLALLQAKARHTLKQDDPDSASE